MTLDRTLDQGFAGIKTRCCPYPNLGVTPEGSGGIDDCDAAGWYNQGDWTGLGGPSLTGADLVLPSGTVSLGVSITLSAGQLATLKADIETAMALSPGDITSITRIEDTTGDLTVQGYDGFGVSTGSDQTLGIVDFDTAVEFEAGVEVTSCRAFPTPPSGSAGVDYSCNLGTIRVHYIYDNGGGPTADYIDGTVTVPGSVTARIYATSEAVVVTDPGTGTFLRNSTITAELAAGNLGLTNWKGVWLP